MPELRGNHAIENAAIAWVMKLERDAGRETFFGPGRAPFKL